MKKKQLETTIFNHYQLDPEKKEAAKFLISNLEIHYSENYRWTDENNRVVEFNELDYQNLEIAVKAFQKLQDSIRVKPKTYVIKDIDILTSEMLIKNIDLAFNAWKNYSWSKSYDFKTFCEYILPYRSLTEPLEDWRADYASLVEQTPALANKNQPVAVGNKNNFRTEKF